MYVCMYVCMNVRKHLSARQGRFFEIDKMESQIGEEGGGLKGVHLCYYDVAIRCVSV